MFRRGIAPVLLAAAIGAFITMSPAIAIEISEETHSNYQAYLKQIGSSKRGAFAVSRDGYYSFYVYCEEANCMSTGIGQEAVIKCQSLSGMECILMADGTKLRERFSVFTERVELSPSDELLKNIVSPEQLRLLVIGNTLSGEYPNGNRWDEYYDPSGQLRGRASEQGSYNASYSFKGDTICFDYAGTDQDWCSQISARGNRIEFVEDGKLVTFIRNTTVLAGNPLEL